MLRTPESTYETLRYTKWCGITHVHIDKRSSKLLHIACVILSLYRKKTILCETDHVRVFERKVGVTHVSAGAKECGQLCVKMFTKLLLGDPDSIDFFLSFFLSFLGVEGGTIIM